ncbi:MAG: cytochrome c biogenesis protein CcsA [Legionellaceae bacterium]|nr:cytochrome c biogenesis protein CcsA [Legionellaceae bacterium]MBP9775958.1 cytochrome c biogenesis protein CcsA [Legionellaceae bacterium]
MWKVLAQIAAPKRFYELTARWHGWLALFMIVFLAIGVVWGLFFAPQDYQQGDAFRLIYVHVPCAVWSMGIYFGMGVLAILLLVWRIKVAGLLLVLSAQMGAWLAFLALVTGSLWGKPMWGTWWVWDARLTSELILLFLYIGILAISYAYHNTERADRMAAILTLVGLVDLPIIHYSVYWWSTLHQGSTLFVFSKPKIHTSMLYPLLLILIGVGLYSLWLILYKARSELLWREHKQAWVKALLKK